MRAIRGVLACTGAVLVLLAACASEWEPAAVLAVGLSGLALCCIAKRMPIRKEERDDPESTEETARAGLEPGAAGKSAGQNRAAG